jgi:hypothetical protein
MTPSFPKHLFHPWAETKQNIRFIPLLYNYQHEDAIRGALPAFSMEYWISDRLPSLNHLPFGERTAVKKAGTFLEPPLSNIQNMKFAAELAEDAERSF